MRQRYTRGVREAGSPQRTPDAPTQASPDLSRQVYEQLRVIAHARLTQQPPGHTLQTTALVHEAFLKMREHSSIIAGEPGRFFHVAAEAMRQILIDHARGKGRLKRGGSGKRRQFADVAELAESNDPTEILALDEALSRLESEQPRAAQVIKLRFFAGLTLEETAAAMQLSERTVKREWQYARAWLFRALA